MSKVCQVTGKKPMRGNSYAIRGIAKKKKGSGLLCFPEMIDAFLDQVFPLLKTSLSIKMRLGRHDSNEVYDLMPILNRYPIEEITIHPRTGIQMYDGHVDLETFEQACRISTHKIIYNGDIRGINDYKMLAGRFDFIHTWMIGRGVLADPFLPMTIKNGCDRVSDKMDRVKHFHDDYFQAMCENLSGPTHVTDRMKAFWSYLAPSLDGGDGFFKTIKKINDPVMYRYGVEDYFDRGTQWIGPRNI